MQWLSKFRHAFRGIYRGLRGDSSFYVHIPAAFLVLAAGLWLEVTQVEMYVLALCIALVMSTELLNSGIESLARAVTADHDPWVRDALDMSSGAVLLASFIAALVGLSILLPPMMLLCM